MSPNSSLNLSSTQAVHYPAVSFQKSVIASNLNSSMILTFLMGIYTMVYFQTFYLYYMRNLSRKSSSNKGDCSSNEHGRVSKVPIIAITGLYMICLCLLGLNWYYLEWVIVEQGDTRASMFVGSMGEAPNWFLGLSCFLQYLQFVIADGLLIWRCYHVWNRSVYVIAILLPLLLAETGLGLATTIYSVTIPVLTSVAQANMANDIQAAAPFVSFGTTILTTILIAYRIRSTTRLGGVISSLERFQHIMIVILESGAAYSVVLLFWAILNIIPASFNIDTESPIYFSTFYVYAILLMTGGLAPTIVVARIVTSENNASGTGRSTGIQISDLQFHNEGPTDSHNEKLDV